MEMNSSAPSHVASQRQRNDDRPSPSAPTSVLLLFWTLRSTKHQEITCTESIITYNQAKINEQ